MAANGSGRRKIAEELDRLKIKPPEKDYWEPSTVIAIIQNEAYIGNIIWGKIKYSKIDGKYNRKKIDREYWNIHENAHEPIINKDLFEQANATLEELIDQFELPASLQKKINSTIKSKEKILITLEKEKKEIVDQCNNIHDLLKKKVYDIETFIQRQQILKDKFEGLNNKIEEIQNEINLERQQQLAHSSFIPKIKSVLEAYHSTQEAEKKNRLLKSVIEKAIYLRKKEWMKPDQFEIKLYTKI